MARAPVPGATKTRLEPLLGAAGCARLQAVLIRDTVATARRAAPGAVFVACAGPRESLRPLVGPGTRLFDQEGADLGARMSAAVTRVRAARPGPVIVVGTDCPTLRPAHLGDASAALADGHDVVFGPARDGGYYLVASDGPAEAVFALPPGLWGGPEVLARSLAAADAAGLRTALIDVEQDLDTPADAADLAADPRVPAEIARLLDPRGVGR